VVLYGWLCYRVSLASPFPRLSGSCVTAADRLLTVDETRALLGCSPGTVENLARKGFLEKVHVLTAVRYRASDVELIVRHGTRRGSYADAVPAGGAGASR
jgi:hypothetical protein